MIRPRCFLQLTKEFTDDPVGSGDQVTLEFTIANPSPTSGMSDLTFTDELTTFLGFPISATLPPGGFCGPGSSIVIDDVASL